MVRTGYWLSRDGNVPSAHMDAVWYATTSSTAQSCMNEAGRRTMVSIKHAHLRHQSCWGLAYCITMPYNACIDIRACCIADSNTWVLGWE